MKISPEILLSSKKEINYNKILVTGLDEAFIAHVKDFIINNFKKRNFFIDLSGAYNKGLVGGLFTSRKTLFLMSDFSIEGTNAESLDEQCFLITCANGKKANAIKTSFLKLKDALIVECYTLNRKSKEAILEHFIKNHKIEISYDVFCYVIDNFDNSYAIFINQLKILSIFSKKINLISDVEKIAFDKSKIEINKIFFNILKKNSLVIGVFNKSINSISDFYVFLNSTKTYIGLISESPNKESAITKFPRYLFAEKDVFLKIYNQINQNKLIKIYKIISKTEIMARKNTGLYGVIGLRFLLNLKKIIIS